MNAIDVCPRCGSQNTEVFDYLFEEGDIAKFYCCCKDCMRDDDESYWELSYEFKCIKCTGFEPYEM